MFANPFTAALKSAPRSRPGLTLGELVVATAITAVMGGVFVAFFLPVSRTAREPARRSQCKNNFKQIGLALHNYHDQYHALPPAYTVDADGKPLHSWRTLILPFLEQKPLYDKIDLTKAWDDPANAEVYKTVLEVYRCPSLDGRNTHTTYLAIVTPNSCLRGGESRLFSEITDGLSNTLVVIEVDSEHAVHWMSPMDADESMILSIGPNSKVSHTGGVHGLLMDGAVRFLNAQIPAETRRALISVAGNEPLTDY